MMIFFLIFWLCWVIIALCRQSPFVMSGSYSLLQCTGFSLRCLLLLLSTSFSSCGTWTQLLWHTGSAALQHVESFWLRPRIEPVSSALVGKFLSTAPPGKSWFFISTCYFFHGLKSCIVPTILSYRL